MRLTPELLREATGCSPAAAELYAGPLAEAMSTFGIDSPEQIAAFLAQVAHESGGLAHVREIWGPTPAQERYEGREDLGNTQLGDGRRYLGRGLLQITGRAGYAAARDRLRERSDDSVPDFEAAPDELERPRWAALTAAEWWHRHDCNRLATGALDDYVRLGRLINRGNANSPTPANGEGDRVNRWVRARRVVLDVVPQAPAPAPAPAPAFDPLREGDVGTPPAPAPVKEKPMAPILAAVLPSIVEAIPKLAGLFGSGSRVAERNVKAAETVLGIVQQATGAVNAQDAAEKLQSDPAARVAAQRAIEQRWYEISSEAAPAAKAADAAFIEAGHRPWQSPSMWALLLLLPLAYMVVGSVVGLWGAADWSPDVRAAISTAVVSLIIGGAAGYYWGATTSRNRAAGGQT